MRQERFDADRTAGKHHSIESGTFVLARCSMLGFVLLILLVGMRSAGAGAQSGAIPPAQLQADPPPDPPHYAFLPVIPRDLSTDPAVQAMDRLNYYRALAGVPQRVLEQGRKILHQLETGQIHALQQTATAQRQIDMFERAQTSPLVDAFQGIEPDNLTPRQALDLMYQLKTLTDDAPALQAAD